MKIRKSERDYNHIRHKCKRKRWMQGVAVLSSHDQLATELLVDFCIPRYLSYLHANSVMKKYVTEGTKTLFS